MPRNIDPDSLTVGGGLAANDSVESNAFVHPTQGLDGLTAHIQDPSRAHEARAINVIDTAGNFASDHVEGALAEIAGSADASRSSGILTGGTFAASSGLTFELDATTEVLLTGTLVDYSGVQVALTPSTTQYVYIDKGTGALTAGALPTLVSEPILIAEVTTDGVGITSSRDLRFFVFNLDRKNALIVRSAGADFNQRSEANFVTLEAALAYLELYAGGGTTDPVETHQIIVRGSHTVSATYTLPVDGIIFLGDGDAEFVDATGGGTMFTISGRDRVRFFNLTFTANAPGTTALAGDDPLNELVLRDCSFVAGGDSFGAVLNIANVAAAGAQRIFVQNCYMQCYSGISIGRPTDCRILDCRFTGAGGASGSGVGITLGTSAFPDQGRNQVHGCRLTGFLAGINSDDDHLTVSDTVIADVNLGIDSAGTNPTFSNVTITMDNTDGERGINITGGKAQVTNCRIVNPRTVWVAETPAGISFSSAEDCVVMGCHIEGFLNDNNATGFGVNAVGACPNLRVGQTTVRSTIIGVEIAANTSDWVKITDCMFDICRIGVRSTGDFTHIAGCDIELSAQDDATGAIYGIQLNRPQGRVNNCRIVNNRSWLSGPTGDDPIGVWFATGSNNSTVDDSMIFGFYNETDELGNGVVVAASATKVAVRGCHISGSPLGIDVAATATQFTGSDCTIESAVTGIRIIGNSTDDRHLIDNCRIVLDSDRGLEGIVMDSVVGATITGCDIQNDRTLYGASDKPYGIALLNTPAEVNVQGCRIENFLNTAASPDLGVGVYVDAGSTVSVSDVIVRQAVYGVLAENTSVVLNIANCEFRAVETGAKCDGSRNTISGCYVETEASRGRAGVEITGNSHRITDTMILNLTTTGFPLGYHPVGIDIQEPSQGINITGCHLQDWWNSTDSLGSGIALGNNCNLVTISNTQINQSGYGIRTSTTGASTQSRLTVADTIIRRVATGMQLYTTRNTITGCLVELDTNEGVSGIVVGDGITLDSTGAESGAETLISNCRIENERSSWTTEVPIGVHVQAPNAKVDNCVLINFINTTTPEGAAVRVDDNVQCSVTDSTMIECYRGVDVTDGCTDITISNNLVVGNSLTTDGVRVTGDNSAGNRTSSIVVSDNIINGCVDYGVYLLDHVFNTTVSGNKIDGWIGTGVEVTAAGIRLDGGASGNVEEYHAITGNTISNSTHGILMEGVAGDATRRSVIADNVIHHIAVGETPADTFIGAGALGIGVDNGLNIIISGNQVYDIGTLINPTGTTFTPAAVNYSAQGIYCLNSGQMTIDGNNVRSTNPAGTGTGRGIALRQRQNPGARAENSFIVSDNIVSGTGDAGIVVDVEDSGGAGDQTMRGISISGNVIRNPGSLGIRLNATGNGANTGLLEGVSVSGNTVDGATGGIRLNCDARGVIRAAAVDGNSIVDDLAAAVSLDCLAANASIEGCTVNDNTIENSSTYGVVATVAFASAFMENLSISGNTIRNTGNFGIYTAVSLNLTATGAMPGLAINGNSLSGTGSDSIRVDAIGLAILVGGAIRGNAVNDSAASAISVFVNTGVIAGFSISSNTLTAPTTHGIVARATGLNGSLTDLNLSDNNIYSPGVHGVYLTADSGNTGSFGRFTISNTQVSNPAAVGIYVYGEDEDIVGCQISNCTVSGGGAGASMTHGILVQTAELAGAVQRHDIQATNIYDCIVGNSANPASSMVAGIKIDAAGIWTACEIRGCVVTGFNWAAGAQGIAVENTFNFSTRVNCAGLLLAQNQITLVPHALELISSGTATAGFRDISIIDNQVSSCGKGLFINADTYLPGIEPAVKTFAIRGNSFDTIEEYGLQIGSFSASTPTASTSQGAGWEGFDISHNQFNLTNTLESATDDTFALFLDVPVQNWNITHNNFQDTNGTDGSVTVGVATVHMSVGNGTVAGGLQNFNFCHNQIWSSQGRAVNLIYGGTNQGQVRNFNFCHNSIKNVVLSTGEINQYAINIDFTEADNACDLVRINDNSIQNGTEAGGFLIECPSNNPISNWQINGNNIMDMTATGGQPIHGIYVQAFDDAVGVQVCGNNIASVDNGSTNSYGIEWDTEDNAAENGTSLMFANNIITNSGGTGLLLSVANVTTRLVCSNNVVGASGTSNFAFAFGVSGTAVQWAVVGNTSGNATTNSVFSSIPAGASANQVQANTGTATGDGWAELVLDLGASTAGNTN